MSTEIIVSVISLLGTIVGSLGGVLVSSRLTTYRIQKLEERVAKHNNLIDRVYRLEEKAKLEGERIKVANHRIDDLEDLNT